MHRHTAQAYALWLRDALAEFCAFAAEDYTTGWQATGEEETWSVIEHLASCYMFSFVSINPHSNLSR